MSADELAFTPAWRLAEMVRAREVSPLEIADLALARIERLNPALNAFILLYPDETRAAAREAGRRARGGEAPGPLHGVQVSI